MKGLQLLPTFHRCTTANVHINTLSLLKMISIIELSTVPVVAPLGALASEGDDQWRTSSPTGPVSDLEAAP